MYDLKDMIAEVKAGGKVTFLYYHSGDLWYRTDSGFEFPVPVSDTGTGLFKAEDKMLFFMRWIRKHIQRIEEGRNECAEVA